MTGGAGVDIDTWGTLKPGGVNPDASAGFGAAAPATIAVHKNNNRAGN